MFANMYAAYEELSEPMKQLLAGCTAIHDSSKAHSYRVHATDRADLQFPRAEHPVVRTHPVTGRKLLFANRGFTTRIPQLKRHESDALLEMLYRHIETPEFHCRFKWQAGSVAFWDNRATQHHALWDYYPEYRYGQRFTVCGDNHADKSRAFRGERMIAPLDAMQDLDKRDWLTGFTTLNFHPHLPHYAFD